MKKQKGAALLMAMACAALVAALAGAALARQSQLIQQEQRTREDRQSAWLLQGAIDWARLVLRQDAMSSQTDHLGEPWAVPIEGASIGDFVSVDKSGDQYALAVLSGRIVDAQSKFNYYERFLNMANKSRDVRELRWQDAYEKLAKLVSESNDLEQFVDFYNISMDPENVDSDSPDILPSNFEGQAMLTGRGDAAKAFGPYVTMVPEAVGINVNTASPEVLAAIVPELSLDQSKRLIQRRSLKPFDSVEEFVQAMPSGTVLSAETIGMLSVASSYFEVEVSVKMEGGVHKINALLKRSERSVSVVWSKRT